MAQYPPLPTLCLQRVVLRMVLVPRYPVLQLVIMKRVVRLAHGMLFAVWFGSILYCKRQLTPSMIFYLVAHVNFASNVERNVNVTSRPKKMPTSECGFNVYNALPFSEFSFSWYAKAKPMSYMNKLPWTKLLCLFNVTIKLDVQPTLIRCRRIWFRLLVLT